MRNKRKFTPNSHRVVKKAILCIKKGEKVLHAVGAFEKLNQRKPAHRTYVCGGGGEREGGGVVCGGGFCVCVCLLLCVASCVCVCARAGELRMRERERARARAFVVFVCVCGCVCACERVFTHTLPQVR